MQQVAAASQASPLLHPLLIRVRRESCQIHLASLQVDREQGFRREEVHSHQNVPGCADRVLPGGRLLCEAYLLCGRRIDPHARARDSESAGKFSTKESGGQFGHCAVDFGPDKFPRGLLPVLNGVNRGPDRQFVRQRRSRRRGLRLRFWKRGAPNESRTGSCLMGVAKGEAGIQRAPTQANLRNQAVTRDDALTKSLRICHSFS